MEQIKTKYKPIKLKTNNGDLAKLYFTHYMIKEQLADNSIKIIKLVLTKDILPKEYRIIKQYKDYILYQEFMTIKSNTLYSILKTVSQNITLNI